MAESITKIALDTHKNQHTVAMVDIETGEMNVFSVKNTAKDIKKMVVKIKKQSAGLVHFCYEAGVCGFALKRQLEALGRAMSLLRPWCRQRRGIGLKLIVEMRKSCWASLSRIN